MQYTSQSQSVVQNRRDQNGAKTFVVPNQSQKISSPKSVTSRRRDVAKGI